jgi:hypothetical protein
MAIPAMLSAWHSDKTGERRWHAGGPIVFVGFGLMLSLWAGNNLALAIGAFSLATMALYAFPAPFWALSTTFLSGTAAAAGIALINSIGNLGGFVGPYAIGFLTDRTGTYTAGLSYLVASGVIGGVLLLSLRSDGAGSATVARSRSDPDRQRNDGTANHERERPGPCSFRGFVCSLNGICEMTSSVPVADPELPFLASPRGQGLAKALRAILREVHFDQVNRDLRLPRFGGDYEIRPFPLPTSPVDMREMKVRLRGAVKASRHSEEAVLARRIQRAFALFMFGQALPRDAVEELFGDARAGAIDDGFAAGLFVQAEGRAIRTNGLSLFSRTLANGDVVHLFADTPPHFETRAASPRVYAGADSYELMARVSATEAVSGVCVEMGSGSGIQLIAALKQHPAIVKAIGRERDRRAVHVSLSMPRSLASTKPVIVRWTTRFGRAPDGQAITFAMSNPLFIAMPAWIDLDEEDCASLRGLIDIRESAHGCQGDLRALFPEAGWGGDDGLAVTKTFIDDLFALLADNSRMVIYSQFAGDGHGPSVLRDDIRRRSGLRFAFEPVTPRRLVMQQPSTDRIASGESRTVLTAGEAAMAVARLIVSALLAREHPERVRLAVRKGGREDGWQTKFAARIEARYRAQGVTHFHDGFVVLTKELPHVSAPVHSLPSYSARRITDWLTAASRG